MSHILSLAARIGFVSLALGAALASAQQPLAPLPGLRESTPNVHALTNAKIVMSPERTIEKGTIFIRDGVLVAVGERVTPPADARVWNLEGKTLYPGLIDAYGELTERNTRAAGTESAGAGYWNSNIVP